MSNLLLERLINKYKENFAVTEKIFGGKIKFGIIVVDKDIKQITQNKINLLIDFLKHIKKISSQIIHFNNLKEIKAQKEVFSDLLEIYLTKKHTKEKSNKNQGLIRTNDIINILIFFLTKRKNLMKKDLLKKK